VHVVRQFPAYIERSCYREWKPSSAKVEEINSLDFAYPNVSAKNRTLGDERARENGSSLVCFVANVVGKGQ
jgi:hypothetical protein